MVNKLLPKAEIPNGKADAEDREKEELVALKRKEQEAELEARRAEKARKKMANKK